MVRKAVSGQEISWLDLKDLKFGASRETFDDTWFSTDPFHHSTQLIPKMRDIAAAHMAQLNSFELLPETIPWVQFWGIGREVLRMEALRGAGREKLFDGVATVDRHVMLDDHHPAGHFAQLLRENADHAIGVDGAVLAVTVELTSR